MTVLNPKEQFQRFHEEERDKWRIMCGDRTLQMAFSYSIAMLGVAGISREELRGANMLLHTAMHLSDPEISLDEKYPAIPLQEETVKPV